MLFFFSYLRFLRIIAAAAAAITITAIPMAMYVVVGDWLQRIFGIAKMGL